MMKSGVYLIYNPINNKRYIGSSIDVVRRLKEHRRNLVGGYHHNQHLQNAWNKYGDCLEFKPLEFCEPDKLLELELQYIDYYNSADRKFGYNIDAIVDHSNSGFYLSEETKLKLSKAHKGKKISKDVVEKIRLALIGKPKPTLSKTMKQKYINGECPLKRYNNVSKELQKEWSKHLSESNKKRYSNYANRPKGYFLRVEFDDQILYFPSLREASRSLNVDKGGILYAIKVNNGVFKRLKCKFSRISEKEFMNSEFYNKYYKTSGQK